MPDIPVELKSITKSYGSLLAVDQISLQINPGEVFGLLGPNGAGKTTTIQMICGLIQPDSGEIFIEGQRVVAGDLDVTRRIGVCTQQNILWEKLTCLEQLKFMGEMYHLPASVSNRRANDLLDQLGLAEKRNQLAGKLSGGMQRRLNLALGLVHDPDLVILDEPEAGLDPQSRVMVREYIRSLAPRKTVILTTHNMDEADRLSDRVAIIDHGRLLMVDTPENLKRTVGDGDVIELDIQQEISGTVLEAIRQTGAAISQTNHTLILRERALLEKLPAILDILHRENIQLGEARMRSNTLEDVFISITGRRLRE
jgi:ABC-2 type transport system ATP-binding protein